MVLKFQSSQTGNSLIPNTSTAIYDQPIKKALLPD